jgi:hypothetical protein
MATGKHVIGRAALTAALSIAAIALPFLCAAETTVWAPHGEREFVGRAINKTTSAPVPGAWVFGIYILYNSKGHEEVHCSLAEFARANEVGEYRLPLHDGYPPTFIYAFADRYIWAPWPRTVTRDRFMRWIVIHHVTAGGKVEEVRREGPFVSEEEANKASRIREDVWLEHFDGTDDQWLQRILELPREVGCASKATSGPRAWISAILAEAETAPKSSKRDEVVRKLNGSLKLARSNHPDAEPK